MKRTNMKTKLTAWILATMMIFALVPAMTLTVSAALSYTNLNAAINHARDTYNTSSELCAGFVADCLTMGGINLPSISYASYNAKSGGAATGNVRTWVPSQFQYLIDQGNTVIYGPAASNVAIGDLIYWAFDGVSHVAIVTDKNSNGTPLITQTNNRYRDKVWTDIGSPYAVVKIGGSGSAPTPTPTSSDNPYPVPSRNIYVTPGSEPFMEGEDVKYVQWGLNKIMSAGLDVDGIFGWASESALESFQRTYGLEVDGIFGPASRAKMQEGLIPAAPKTYSVAYDINGGALSSFTGTAQTKTHDVALALTSSKPTRTGYTFIGWSESKTATSATYQAGGNFTKNADTVLYAVWQPLSSVASPTANPTSGEIESGAKITLSTATAGATIHYTTNGSAPTTSSTAYSSPITVTSATTIKAIAAKSGMTNSPVATYNYTIKAEVTPDDGSVTIPGKQNGIKLTAISTDVAVKFDWTPVSGNKWGYRIYRSTTQGTEGISITDFPIPANLSQYVDVNVESYKTYYYTIREVLTEASFDMVNVEIIDEVLGGASEELTISTYEIIIPPPPPPGIIRSFILMEINNEMMQVDDKLLEIDPGRGTTPLNLNGRVMVPVRCVVETVGGLVGWDDAARKVTIDANGHTVIMWLNQRDILVDGANATVDVVPQSINDRTMLPVRFVVENIDYDITWIGSTQQIIIVFDHETT